MCWSHLRDPDPNISAPWLHMNAAVRQHFLWWLAWGLTVFPFRKYPWGSQSESTDENCNESAAKADAGHDLVCIIITIIGEWATEEYRGPWKEQSTVILTEIRGQRAIFSLVERTMVMQQVCQHQWSTYRQVIHQNRTDTWEGKIRQSKTTNYCQLLLIWPVSK